MHADYQTLRLYLDGELDAALREEVASHLELCPECQRRLQEMQKRSDFIKSQLDVLQPAASHNPRPSSSAFHLLKLRKEQNKMTTIRKLRPVWASLFVIAVLGVALSFQPVRAFAHTLLSLFRVQQVETVSLDSTVLHSMSEDSTLGDAVNQLFADSVTELRPHEDLRQVSSVEEASQLAGFSVRLPQVGEPLSKVSLESGVSFKALVDRERVQEILDSSGYSHLVLPDNLDGAEVLVDVPRGVVTEFGRCGENQPSSEDPDEGGYSQPEDSACIRLMQVPSPEVTAPDGLDLVQLAEIGLQFVGVEADEARHIASRIDWATTLVIPVPHQEVQSEDVVVDGSAAVLLREVRPIDSTLRSYMIIWVKDGMLYSLRGYRDPQEGLAIADSLK